MSVIPSLNYLNIRIKIPLVVFFLGRGGGIERKLCYYSVLYLSHLITTMTKKGEITFVIFVFIPCEKKACKEYLITAFFNVCSSFLVMFRWSFRRLPDITNHRLMKYDGEVCLKTILRCFKLLIRAHNFTQIV